MPHDPSVTEFTYQYDPARAVIQPRDYQLELIRALYERTRTATPGARLLIEVATGGGKNLISNNFVWDRAGEGQRVLRVTLNWMLAAQAAADLCGRQSGAQDKISYVGSGAGSRAMNGLPKTATGRIVFTTIQTWNARKDTDFAGQIFDVVVIDELHWGEEAPLYDTLYDRYGGSCTFVGLTATPRRWTPYERVGRAYDLPTLVGMRYLAEPRLQVIRTGVNWQPRRTNEHGDVTAGSLRQLAMSEDRNRLVVSTYVAQAREYGKTIVFACNIAHADALAEMLVARGVRAAALHSNMNDVDRMSVVATFRRSDIDVLVNVVTAVHGLDVPDIRTVMLARPTASDILMMQMIGRGTRLAPGKDFFYLVDFVDNADVHGGVPLVRPEGFIGSRPGAGARGQPIPEHRYDVAALEPFPAIDGYEALHGLLVQRAQTFGIEFELTSIGFDFGEPWSARWRSIAQPFQGLRHVG